MQPYVNPNYFNQNPYGNFNQPMPMQNPYMDRMNQLQNYQQSLQPMQQQANQPPLGLNCRIIDDFNSITANDVPMDGNGAVFMKRDGSQMQWRNWAANGTIQTVAYCPIQPENPSEGTNTPQVDFNALNEDVRALREEISARFDRLEQSIAVPAAKTVSRSKKGDADNE